MKKLSTHTHIHKHENTRTPQSIMSVCNCLLFFTTPFPLLGGGFASFQRHQGNATATAKCMRVTTVTNCKLRMVQGQSTVVCS